MTKLGKRVLPRYRNNIATLPKLHCHATETSLSQRGNNLCLDINLIKKKFCDWKINRLGWKIPRHKLEDRLADNPFLRSSASLYCVYNVRVTAKMEDMVDFFSYINIIAYSSAPLSSR